MQNNMHVLILAPYEKIYPPSNGGMQRSFNLISQISKYNKVVLLAYQSKEDFLSSKVDAEWLENIEYYQVPQISIDKKKNFISRVYKKIYLALTYRIYTRTLLQPADINILNYFVILKRILKTTQIDVVCLDNFGLLKLVPIFKRYSKEIKLVYNAHNIESHLAENYFQKKMIGYRTYRNIQKTEKGLFNSVNDVWACSDIDKLAFEKINKKRVNCAVIPNGVKINNNNSENSLKEFDIIFCGSMNYQPNKEGICWFLENCWENLKRKKHDIKLLIVGSGVPNDDFVEKINIPGVYFKGNVPDISIWYNKAKISIVPILFGSGTRLKILESMAYHVPVVSTTKGAEGIEYTDNHNVLIADSKNDFINNIIYLLDNELVRKEISKNAFYLVSEKYDWDIIGLTINNRLNNL